MYACNFIYKTSIYIYKVCENKRDDKIIYVIFMTTLNDSRFYYQPAYTTTTENQESRR